MQNTLSKNYLKKTFEKQFSTKKVFNKEVVFKPNSPTILAAEHMCLSEICKVAYGTFALCKKDCLNSKLLKQTSLRSFFKELRVIHQVINFFYLGQYVSLQHITLQTQFVSSTLKKIKLLGRTKSTTMGTKYQEASSLYMEDNWKRWQNQKKVKNI